MNQEKIGAFLKQLRIDSARTQEQLAEQLGVNHRTVSRWETGRTMPDFTLLIELGRLYGVTVDELLEGERKAVTASEKEEKAVEKEMVEKIADYTEKEKRALTRRLNRLLCLGTVLMAFSLFLQYMEWKGPLWDALAGFGEGVAFGLLVLGVLMTSWLGPKFLVAKRGILKKIRKR